MLSYLPAPSMYGSYDGTTLVRTSWVPTWAAAYATYPNPSINQTYVDTHVPDVFYDGSGLFPAATATITDVAGGQASYDWMQTNWINNRIYGPNDFGGAYYPWPSGWSIIPR